MIVTPYITRSFLICSLLQNHLGGFVPIQLVVTSFSRYSSSSSSTSMKAATLNSYPELVVMNLDACFWNQDLSEMPSIPTSEDIVLEDLNGRGVGVRAIYSGRHPIFCTMDP
jgi:hypothetical protein